jgi:DUF4097 and DUF4098 domain-containing protein YvlB
VIALLLALAAETGASGDGRASMAVDRPVSLVIRSNAAAVEVVRSPSGALAVSAPGQKIRLLVAGGDRVEVEFGGKRQLHHGTVKVELPRGSALDAGAISGQISVTDVGGPARIRGMSGDVKIAGATEVDAETVDGTVTASAVSGPLRIHTVSGGVVVETSQPASRLDVETASGNVHFRGPCGPGCQLDVDTVSGEVSFALDRKSSLSARVVSTSGKVRDELGLQLRRKTGASEGDFAEGALGAGDGLIECETFSGDVTFSAR